MLIIGLTGGIGCGKTAVTDGFAKLGVPIIDADVVAREVVLPGKPALEKIAAHFGRDALTTDGELNRPWMREHIFSDPVAKATLESILHPIIRAEMRRQLSEVRAPYAIFSIPLLFETGQEKSVDRILVVDCPTEIQVSRVTQRDQTPEAQTRAIIATQIDRASRLASADDIIDNSGSLIHLHSQIDTLHQKYLKLAN